MAVVEPVVVVGAIVEEEATDGADELSVVAGDELLPLFPEAPNDGAIPSLVLCRCEELSTNVKPSKVSSTDVTLCPSCRDTKQQVDGRTKRHTREARSGAEVSHLSRPQYMPTRYRTAVCALLSFHSTSTRTSPNFDERGKTFIQSSVAGLSERGKSLLCVWDPLDSRLQEVAHPRVRLPL